MPGLTARSPARPQVYKAHRFGVQPVAAKVLREESGKQIENFKREIDLLRGLRDNNIVLFLGVCKKDGQLMLVTEYMPQGDLWHALNHSRSSKFTWYQRCARLCIARPTSCPSLHSRLTGGCPVDVAARAPLPPASRLQLLILPELGDGREGDGTTMQLLHL